MTLCCCVQIHAHVTRDWQGHWRVVIADQFPYHNHGIPASVSKQYAETEAASGYLPPKAQELKAKRPKKRRRKRKSPQQQLQLQPAALATETVKVAEHAIADDVSADQSTSDSDWTAHKEKPMKQMLGPNADEESDVDAPAFEEADDAGLGRSGAHANAAEVSERDCRVHPMQKKTFQSWAELDAYLDKYSHSSHQVSLRHWNSDDLLVH